jgi:hypothetical protein
MDFQNLCELADKEIKLGLQDRALMAKAESEAGGVLARAHQIYWRLRATAIQEEEKRHSDVDGRSYSSQLSLQLETEEKRRKRHFALVGWMWAVACFAGVIGAYVFPRIALSRSLRGSLSFYALAVMGVVCLVFSGVAFIVSKRRSFTE